MFTLDNFVDGNLVFPLFSLIQMDENIKKNPFILYRKMKISNTICQISR